MRISRRPFLLVASIATLSWSTTYGQTVPDGAAVERLATGFNFTEGPVYDGNGGLYFSNLYFNSTPSQIIRYDEVTGTTEVVDPDSGKANGLHFDRDGNIISMDMGPAQVSRRSIDDVSVVEEVLTNEWDGREFNSTNDLVIADDGGVYFSDPDYLGRNAQPEGVYYLSPSGELSQVIGGFPRPNGIILSPGSEKLYLAVSEQSRIMAYDVDVDGLPSNEREFTKTSGKPDGLTVDPAGNVYAAVGGTVSAWDATGKSLFKLPVPEQHVSNVTFGGAGGNTLYITASRSLYGIDLLVPDPTADCSTDWGLDASDLSCVSLLQARDSILHELNTLPGDLDGNGDVAFDDFLVLSSNYGMSQASYADGNIDLVGNVDFKDFVELAYNFGRTPNPAAAIPEPTGFAIIGVGLFAALACRRGQSRSGRSSDACGSVSTASHHQRGTASRGAVTAGLREPLRAARSNVTKPSSPRTAA